MITVTDIRAEARDCLRGKWIQAIFTTLIFTIFNFLLSYLENKYSVINGVLPFIFAIVQFAINIIITYGLAITFLKLKRGENVSVFDFLTIGFSDFSKAISIFF